MIKAVIKKKGGRFVSYEISGHAGANGANEFDLVCADVSVLSITTANNFHKMCNVKPIAEMEEGYLYVELPITLPKKQEENTQFLFQAFVNAMEEVVGEYPQYIKLIMEGN
ncbi:MAG: ribosomal-processing cysteine protease Prp [Streptococcaceae bacterium]|jgi:uncharacterized protein YsxB (DUF464 family)|nr:ribosomal-processing cysteine protease Prp [Streptococcaceae bacterium]